MAKKIEYFRIKNWEKYQHRDHKKTMIWFKAYPNILNDPEFMDLSEGNRLAWLLLLHYCCTTGNKLTTNCRILRARLGMKRLPDMALFESMGWIEKIECGESAVTPRLDLDKRRKDFSRVDLITSLTENERDFLLQKMKKIGKKIK
jgi:hypothetical protein